MIGIFTREATWKEIVVPKGTTSSDLSNFLIKALGAKDILIAVYNDKPQLILRFDKEA